MASSELELARKYLRLTQKVVDTKKAELVEALALVKRLQEEVTEAEHEFESAKSCLSRVERELEVVEIDENDYTESGYTNIGLPLVPTHPMRTLLGKSQNNSQLGRSRESPKNPARLAQLLMEEELGIFQNKILPSSLRRCLKRHQRKIVRLCEEQERKEVEARQENLRDHAGTLSSMV